MTRLLNDNDKHRLKELIWLADGCIIYSNDFDKVYKLPTVNTNLLQYCIEEHIDYDSDIIIWQNVIFDYNHTLTEGGEMIKPIPEFDIEVAECELRDALNNQTERNLFDAILQYYLEAVAQRQKLTTQICDTLMRNLKNNRNAWGYQCPICGYDERHSNECLLGKYEANR